MAHLGRLGEIGAVVARPHFEFRPKLRAQRLDRRRLAEAVQHQVGAGAGERPRDAQADAARRAGDHGNLSAKVEHRLECYEGSFCNAIKNLRCNKAG